MTEGFLEGGAQRSGANVEGWVVQLPPRPGIIIAQHRRRQMPYPAGRSPAGPRQLRLAIYQKTSSAVTFCNNTSVAI
jgi:hypothetical protein